MEEDNSEDNLKFNFSAFNVCVLCTSDLKDKNAKLLPCLHTLCENCLNSLFQVQVQQKRPDDGTGENSSETSNTNEDKCSILCPACNTTVEKKHVLDNMFVGATLAPITIEDDEEEKQKVEETQKCTGCEEDSEALSFCTDCKEWLCDQCVFAHKRVKITKDHTIQPKEEAQNALDRNSDPTPEKLTFCKVHKNEQLKLFCETCDKLTCRDCQLLEHKDHKYQFLTEAIVQQREQLQNVVLKLKQKRQNYQQADKILASKNTELKNKLESVCTEIRDITAVICKEINNHADSLVSCLEKYINKKTTVIIDKKTNVGEALQKMGHAIDFVENVLTVGDDSSILYTRGVMVKRLTSLSAAGIAFDPSILHYNIDFGNEKDFLLKNTHKAGWLMIDGSKYCGGNQPHPTPPAPQGIAHQIPTQPVRGHSVQSAPIPRHVSAPQRPLMQQFNPNINPMFQEKMKHLPLEQQNQLRKKMYEKFLQHQRESQQQGNRAPPPYNPGGPSPSQVSSSLQNLSSLVNSGSHLAAAGQYPRHTYPPNSDGYPLSNKNNSVHSTGTYYPPGDRRTFNPYSQVQNPGHVQGMTSQQGVRPHMSSASYSSVSRMPTQQGGGMVGGYQQRKTSPTTNKSWAFHDMANRFSPSSQAVHQSPSPGAHGASFSVQTPSPAGAGFDHIATSSPSSQTAQSHGGVIHTSDSHNVSAHMKTETERSPCLVAEGRSQNNVSMTRTDDKRPTPPLVPTRTPPPLIRVGNMPQPTTSSSALPLSSPASAGKVMPSSNEDPNEDYCAVCQNGGDLLCCESCPKVFHLKCHIPELKEFPIGEWQCALCAKEEDMIITEPEKKDYGFVGPGKRKAPSGLSNREIKTCERILLLLYCNKDSTVFHEPVSKAVPNYYKIITKPIDFSKIKSKLQRHHFNHYNTVEDFIVDCKLVFRNCFTYNALGTPIYNQGKMVEEEFERLVHRFLPCYVEALEELERKTETPLSDSSDSNNSDKKSKKKRYEDDPDVDPEQLVTIC